LKDFIVFVHIEKASGTTLHNWLKYNIPGYLSIKSWNPWTNESDAAFSPKDLKMLKFLFPFLKGIGGHSCRNYLDYQKVIHKNVRYFTFFREPKGRYLSHLQYQIDKKDIQWTVDSFLDETRFNNFMTKRIAGSENLDIAIEKLNDFDFIGLTEKFNESLILLNSILFENEFNTGYEKLNIGLRSTKINFESLTSAQKEKLLKNNELDIKLYKYAVEKKFDAYKKAFHGDLPKAVDELMKKADSFSYNTLKKNMVKLMFMYNQRVAQPILKKMYH